MQLRSYRLSSVARLIEVTVLQQRTYTLPVKLLLFRSGIAHAKIRINSDENTYLLERSGRVASICLCACLKDLGRL